MASDIAFVSPGADCCSSLATDSKPIGNSDSPASFPGDEPPKASTISSQNKDSRADSGYASNARSPNQPVNQDFARHPNAGAIPLSFDNGRKLQAFKRQDDPGIDARFKEIVPEIERLLMSHLKDPSGGLFSRRKRYRPTPMSIRSMFLGNTESDAKQCIVVFCDEKARKGVQEFFRNAQIVKDLCLSPDASVPSFEIIVKGTAPRPRLGLNDFDVQCEPLTPSENTFCGRPISFVNAEGGLRRGTFGGIVKVVHQEGDFHLYGMTAAHGLLDWEDDDFDEDKEGSESDHFIREDGERLNQLTKSSYPKSRCCQENTNAASWESKTFLKLGKFVFTSNQATNANVEYLDWALFEVGEPLQNMLVSTGQQGPPRKQGLSNLPGKICLANNPRRVVVTSGSNGHQSGVLSEQPGRIMLGPSPSFIDAYLLTMDEGCTISDGDSGSWVVDSSTFEVYGHVIASDTFGGIYIIPIVDSLEDIRRHSNAKRVELPSDMDFVIMKLRSEATTVARPVHQELVAKVHPVDPGASPLTSVTELSSMNVTTDNNTFCQPASDLVSGTNQNLNRIFEQYFNPIGWSNPVFEYIPSLVHNTKSDHPSSHPGYPHGVSLELHKPAYYPRIFDATGSLGDGDLGTITPHRDGQSPPMENGYYQNFVFTTKLQPPDSGYHSNASSFGPDRNLLPPSHRGNQNYKAYRALPDQECSLNNNLPESTLDRTGNPTSDSRMYGNNTMMNTFISTPKSSRQVASEQEGAVSLLQVARNSPSSWPCVTCRLRRLKCSQEIPVCLGCLAGHRICRYLEKPVAVGSQSTCIDQSNSMLLDYDIPVIFPEQQNKTRAVMAPSGEQPTAKPSSPEGFRFCDSHTSARIVNKPTPDSGHQTLKVSPFTSPLSEVLRNRTTLESPFQHDGPKLPGTPPEYQPTPDSGYQSMQVSPQVVEVLPPCPPGPPPESGSKRKSDSGFPQNMDSAAKRAKVEVYIDLQVLEGSI